MPRNRSPKTTLESSVKRIYYLMIRRCHNPSARAYHKYGARGIIVCDEWRSGGGLARFMDHIGPRPSFDHTVDRIDNDRGYEPGNVRWATPVQQARNGRHNVSLTAFGKTQCVAAWAEEYGVRESLIRKRIGRAGWTPEDAITRPADLRHRTRLIGPKRPPTASRGEASPRAQMSNAKAAKVVALIAAGLGNKEIAEQLGITTPTVGSIRRGKSWNHIPRPGALPKQSRQSTMSLPGETFGRLTVLRREGLSRAGVPTWLCQCVCGGTAKATANALRRGRIRSCGCMRAEAARAVLAKVNERSRALAGAQA